MDSVIVYKIDRIYRILRIFFVFPVSSGNREKILFILFILSNKKYPNRIHSYSFIKE